MIDPHDITNYNYSNDELEEFLLFAIAVAGKTATVISVKIDEFLALESEGSPFDKVRRMINKGTLVSNMQKVKLGKYALLEKAYNRVIDLDPKACSLEELEEVPGISYKTSRFFVLHTRQNCGDIACIDVHIKRWLNNLGYSGNYFDLEQAFIKEAKSRGRSLAELDLEIWKLSTKTEQLTI